jgi:hypothetical protein
MTTINSTKRKNKYYSKQKLAMIFVIVKMKWLVVSEKN